MTETILSQNGNSLLSHAFVKLRPDIFSHPIWVRFGMKEASASLMILDELFRTAKDLRSSDPSAACQILLICAYYQNFAGEGINALKTAQQAQDLAEETGLFREAIWARWGVCAIYVQEGNYQQAARKLTELGIVLNKQNEWILATFIGELKDYLSNLLGDKQIQPGSTRDHPSENLLSHTFDWLQNWGYSLYVSELRNGKSLGHTPGSWKKLFKAVLLPFLNSFIHPFGILSNKKQKIKQIFEPTLNSYFATPSYINYILDPDALLAQNMPPSSDQSSQMVGNSKRKNPISVSVQMLGTFSIIVQDVTLRLPSSRSISVFKYILLHHKQNIPREVLMDVFWPEAEPETARNNLNVAIYSLRRVLRKVTKIPMIVYENGTYGLDPSLQVWLDVDEFDRNTQAGKQFELQNQVSPALEKYETAISIYQGDFLEENPYEEWTVSDRERLRIIYLDMLDRLAHLYFEQERYAACITICQLLLRRDRCREDAQCLLMRCYSRQGQQHLALRQYHICLEALREELEVEPALETIQLYEKIRRRESV